MEETISLKELFETLRKRMSLILLLTFTAAALSGIVSFFFITPIYQVSTQLLVNRSQVGENFSTNEVQTNIQLINTYSGIITSPRILDIAADELNNLNETYTTSNLKNMINVQSGNNSQIISITVENANPANAVIVANKVADVFQREIPEIMNVDNVSILAPAEATEQITPVKPQPLLNIAIALVVGLMAGVGLAFLLEYLDNTIKTEQDINKILEIPVLGIVTTFDTDKLDERMQSKSGKVRTRGERRA